MDPHINPETGVWDDNYYARTYGGGGGGGGSIAPFNFDYEAAAKEAYGELGVYYDRLLKESKGDLNLALSRLVEDYDRGVRIRTEDMEMANQDSINANQRNALARGIYQKSMFGGENRGIADVENPNNPFGEDIRRRGLSFDRANEGALIERRRTETDLPEKQRRYEGNLEQQRRMESASLADSKANKALQKYQAGLTLA